MSRGPTDWTQIGMFPLQDHDIDDVKLGVRQQLVGFRIAHFPDPDKSTAVSDSLIEWAEENDMGTVGDLHPWFYWQTTDRAERPTGAWQGSFATISVDGAKAGRGGIGASELLPMRFANRNGVTVDGRFAVRKPAWSSCFSTIPQGTMMLAMPAMEETSQHDTMLHVDPRLVAASLEGPGEAGTLVCDLQPEGEMCMHRPGSPGVEGRAARLQSMMRVIALGKQGIPRYGTGPGNSIAWNLSHSGKDALAGWGLCWAIVDGGGGGQGPTTGGPSKPGGGPITHGPGTAAPRGGSFGKRFDKGIPTGTGGGAASGLSLGGGPEGGNGSPGGPAESGGGPGRHERDGDTPCDFGKFTAKRTANHGSFFAAQIPTFGPFHAGHEQDQHRIGSDRDGNPINAGHLSTNAYHYRDSFFDGPQLFERIFPKDVKHFPLRSHVHQEFDPKLRHPGPNGGRGMWRWWAEVPYCCPDKKDDDELRGPLTPRKPRGPTTGGPPNPGNPVPTGPRGGPRSGGPNQPPGPGPGNPPPTGGPGSGPKTGGTAPGRPGRTGPRGGESAAGGGEGHGFGSGIPEFHHDTGEFVGIIEGSGGYGEGSGLGRRDMGAQVIREVGQVDADHHSLFAYFHPIATGFAELSFRPQLMALGAQAFTHNPDATSEAICADEERRPQVLAARAWGATESAGSEFTYVESPETSRARGGTGHGGILLTPPRFELEDYLDIGANTDTNPAITETDYTVSYLCAAPGVALALGEPKIDGGLTNSSIVIGQDATDRTHNPFRIAQYDQNGTLQDLIKGRVYQSGGSADEIYVEVGGTTALNIPSGTDAQRPNSPVAGDIRLSTTATANFEGYDGSAWLDLSSSGVSTFTALTDTPGSYAGEGSKSVRVNAGETALEFFTAPVPPSELNDMSDFNATSPADGQVLRYEADDSEWQNTSALLIDDSSQVGIGGAPSDLFHVSATGDADALRVDDTTGGVMIQRSSVIGSSALTLGGDIYCFGNMVMNGGGTLTAAGSNMVVQTDGNLTIDIDKNDNSTTDFVKFTRDGKSETIFYISDDGEIGVGIDNTSPSGLFHVNTTGGDAIMCEDSTSRTSMGHILSPGAQLDVQQAGATDAVPVLLLEQKDIDDAFINFVGTTAADGSRSISTDTGELGAVVVKVLCEYNGTQFWIRGYADHT